MPASKLLFAPAKYCFIFYPFCTASFY